MKKIVTLTVATALAIGTATLVAQTHKDEKKAEHKDDHKGKSK